MEEFVKFPKIARLSREMIITEKIDGTNAQIFIGEDGEFFVGSRTRWITPAEDNYGFAKWAYDRKDELMGLGKGHHFGEWWGKGIQRGYGLEEKRFSLFNVTRWCLHDAEPERIITGDPTQEKYQQPLPACVGLVPIIHRGLFDTEDIGWSMDVLEQYGSIASPGYMEPEGVVVFHTGNNICFKKTFKNDEAGKG